MKGKKDRANRDNKNLYESLVVISGENVEDKINDLRVILDTSPDLAEKN